MKNLKKTKMSLMLFLLGLLLFSCNKQDESLDIKQDLLQENNLVSKNSAELIAKNLLFNENLSNPTTPYSKTTVKKFNKKDVESIFEVPDKNNQTAYFIINYKAGGFVILAGDKRSEPILAFSETNSFDLNQELYPSGLVNWLYVSKVNMEKIRETKTPISNENKIAWENLLTGDADVVTYRLPIEDPSCDAQTIQKGPLLQTTWGQGCGYNSQTPSMSCGPCGRAWTGCVATAMAQVMRYYAFPNNYNWTAMPNTSGTNSTAILMSDIGNAVDMDYTCNGSGANTENEVASSFRNDFGYSTASYADYNYQTVKNELDRSRPVILKGRKNTGWWIFGNYDDGHAWVSDGYLSYTDPCWGSMLKYNMNWGWNNGTHNGWYSFNNFNPGNLTFNYKTGMVYNIKP
ncbi:MAG: hypothetical protein COZ18_07150 [Flexibacter sp. CG_4_10_14_3_um_filter_32_15]|nr:MAG: hypothetical protein COZ18_07150 [Flexibacter sp. CG_4_10_14_3_um_filter_32_15]